MAEKKKTSTASKASAKSASRRTSSNASRKEQRPYRREVWAVVCLSLAVLLLLGLFGMDAALTTPLVDLTRALIGAGVYILPLALALDFVILLFHDGRPVRLRVCCTLLFCLCIGVLAHLWSRNTVEIPWSFSMVGELWRTGVGRQSGGLVAGFLGMLLSLCITEVGTSILMLVLLVITALYSVNMTVLSLLRAIRNRPRPSYDPPKREHRDTAEVLVNHVAQRQIERTERRRVRVSDYDLPVDDPPALPKPEPKPEPKAAPELPPVPAVKEPEPAPMVLPSKKKKKPEPEPIEEEIPEEELPPIEPLEDPSKKVKKEEALLEAAKIASEIELGAGEQQKIYAYPPVSLLQQTNGSAVDGTEEMQINAERLKDTLNSFHIDANLIEVIRGPSVTRYELELDRGVKLSKITNLADDIALALGATGVRISAIPDKISVVGIEVPNKLVSTVRIHDVIDSVEFHKSKSRISFAVGKDISGKSIIGDIAKMPHLLIAGTTGSGKSVCMNSLIVSLLYRAKPEEVRLIMVDPKMVELGNYSGIPHLLIPVVTDPKKAAGALQWAVTEMMKRYRLMADAGVKDLESYNRFCETCDDGREKFPQLIVIIDELADLMLVAAKEVEESICRVAQMGRASGVHLVIATQRPSADVITGLMKANIPSRIAFAVASAMESRIILDTTGAEKLVGKGDMLFAPLGQGKPRRVQGCFITEEEVEAVVRFIKQNAAADYDDSVMEEIEQKVSQGNKPSGGAAGLISDPDSDEDEMVPAAIEVIFELGKQASTSMLQRRLKLGYARAARIMDVLEEKGIVGPSGGAKPRDVLITKEQWLQMQGLAPETVEDDAPEEEEIP